METKQELRRAYKAFGADLTREYRAFADCVALSTVRIPDTLTDLTGNPFTGCKTLTSLAISDTHPTLELKEGVLFNKVTNELLCYPWLKSKEEYTVPEGTERIGVSAFENNKKIKHIDFVENIINLPADVKQFFPHF